MHEKEIRSLVVATKQLCKSAQIEIDAIQVQIGVLQRVVRKCEDAIMDYHEALNKAEDERIEEEAYRQNSANFALELSHEQAEIDLVGGAD